MPGMTFEEMMALIPDGIEVVRHESSTITSPFIRRITDRYYYQIQPARALPGADFSWPPRVIAKPEFQEFGDDQDAEYAAIIGHCREVVEQYQAEMSRRRSNPFVPDKRARLSAEFARQEAIARWREVERAAEAAKWKTMGPRRTRLSERQRVRRAAALRLRRQGKTLKEIAAAAGLTEEGARMMVVKAEREEQKDTRRLRMLEDFQPLSKPQAEVLLATLASASWRQPPMLRRLFPFMARAA